MRQITPDTFAVYQLDELEPDAREKAIEGIAEKLGGDWWDSNDIDDIASVMVYTLANEFGTPEHGKWGVADFPGIDGVTLESWDLDRGSYVGLRGTLTRENAPALPWADGVVEVGLTSRRDYTEIDVVTDEDELDPEQERDLTVVREECKALADAVQAAVEAAMQAALRDGRAELEYKTGAEYAKGFIESNEYEFLEDGTLYA
jgi:hypothetical protein